MKTGHKAFISLAVCPGEWSVRRTHGGKIHFNGQASKELRVTMLETKTKEDLRLLILDSVDECFGVQKIAQPELSFFKKLFRRNK